MTHPRLGTPAGPKPANGTNGKTNGKTGTAVLDARRRPGTATKKRAAPEKAESPFVEKGQAWLLALRGGVVIALATFALVALSEGISKPVLGERDAGAVLHSLALAPAHPDLVSGGAPRAATWPLEDEERPGPGVPPPAARSGGGAASGSPSGDGKASPEEARPAAAEAGTATGSVAAASRVRRPQGSSAALESGGNPARQGSGVKRRTSVAIEEEKIVTKAAAPKPRVLTSQPEVTFRPKPVYPPPAIKKELEGAVRVKFVVTTTGSVKNLEVIWAEPQGSFEAAVTEAVSQWRFVPGKDQDGKPMEADQVYTYRFVLEGSGG